MPKVENDRARELEKALYANIPIAASMGARAMTVSDERVALSAPLGPNTNHANTAFGGSVYSVAVLSRWALASETARAAGLDCDYIVVQDGEIDYLLPVASDFTAEASWLKPGDREKFVAMLGRKGRARATLESQVKAGGVVCAKLRARFAAQLKKDAN